MSIRSFITFFRGKQKDSAQTLLLTSTGREIKDAQRPLSSLLFPG